jgi:hypothetical protein
VADDVVMAMPVDLLFDFAGVHVAGERAAGVDLRMDFTFSDLDETWTVRVANGVLNARLGATDDAQVTVTGPKAAIVGAVLQPATVPELVEAGMLELGGDETVLEAYAAVLDEFDKSFPIGTPERAGAIGADTTSAQGEDHVLRLGVDMGFRLSAATLRRLASLGQAALQQTRAAADRIT